MQFNRGVEQPKDYYQRKNEDLWRKSGWFMDENIN